MEQERPRAAGDGDAVAAIDAGRERNLRPRDGIQRVTRIIGDGINGNTSVVT